MVLSPTEHLDSAKISSNGFKFSTIVFRVYDVGIVAEIWKPVTFNEYGTPMVSERKQNQPN